LVRLIEGRAGNTRRKFFFLNKEFVPEFNFLLDAETNSYVSGV